MRRKEEKKRQRDSQEVEQESFREEVGAGGDGSAVGRWELTSSTAHGLAWTLPQVLKRPKPGVGSFQP